MKKEIKEKIMNNTKNGKLSCAAARKIAEELGIPYKEVGAAADQLKIKISNCQLGCF
jgi:hypothetical protein